MSDIGYYRYKTIADESKPINFIVNGALAGTKTVIPIDFCDGGKILKYLDKNGQYRFFPFNKYYETNDNPQSIGKANKIITSILDGQSNRQNIGYKNERQLSLTADVPNDQLDKLVDIYTSPRVYLYIGNGSQQGDQYWVLLDQIISSDNIVKRRKANSGQVNITAILPENFTIKMI